MGTMYGSVINRLMERSRAPQPEVGMGVTVTGWSDRTPGTIIEIVRYKTGARAGQVRLIRVQEDRHRVVGGSVADGSARYEYERNPDGRTSEFRIRQGAWHGDSGGLVLGVRQRYWDPSF